MSASIAVLATALLFGGMTLYAFGFAAFVFSALPAATAGPVLRRAFPWFYGFVALTAAVAAAFWWPNDMARALCLAAIAGTTLPVWAWLMPAINRATDAGRKAHFRWLHAASVLVTLAHIGASGWVLAGWA